MTATRWNRPAASAAARQTALVTCNTYHSAPRTCALSVAQGAELGLGFQDTVDKLDYQIARYGWIGDFIDPTTFLDLFRSDDTNNKTGWANAYFRSHGRRSLQDMAPPGRAWEREGTGWE